MLSFKTEIKRAATTVLQSVAHPGRLNVSLLDQKLLEDSFCKVASVYRQASLSLLQWTSHQEEEVINELYTRLADLDILHSNIYKRFAQQMESVRLCYKEIAKGEKQLLDLKKEYESMETKTNKIRKQYDSVKKKEKGKVPDSLEAELTAAYAQETEAAKRLTEGKDNHKHFKFSKVKEALRTAQTATENLHKEGVKVAKVQDKIIQLFIGPESENNLTKAGILAASLITSLAEDVGMPRPISIADKKAGASFQTHQALRTSDPGSSRSSVAVYMETPEREAPPPRPFSANVMVDRPLPALPLYPSLPSGNSSEEADAGDLYSEQYYSYTDLGDAHPSGILMGGADAPQPPPRDKRRSREDGTALRQRNSAPPPGRGRAEPEVTHDAGVSEETPQAHEYVDLISEGIYDSPDGNKLKLNRNEADRAAEQDEDDDEAHYMSLQGLRRDIPDPGVWTRLSSGPESSPHTGAPAPARTAEEHVYDNRVDAASETLV